MSLENLTEEQKLLLRYNRPTPRYTSYPPANHFTGAWKSEEAEALIRASNTEGPRNMGFYLHIPFCPKRCLFCGCNTEIGRSASFIRTYMEALPVELGRIAALLDSSRPVTQVHFGGGTPNAVPLSFLADLLEALHESFTFAEDAEVAIECDPNLMTSEKVEALSAMGFNRVSYGLQDFNLDVLAAVNRKFPRLHPRDLIAQSRRAGFKGINLDLIYGLPRQNIEGFRETVIQTLEADPDRISLFPYAHVPWMKGHQTMLEAHGFPSAEERLIMATESREALQQAGYVAIGMDHFAKPDDELTLALRSGTLHRNFQGYCPARKAGQIYAVGASAITQLHQGYLQNTRDTQAYLDKLAQGGLAVESGYRMQDQDLIIRSVVQDLLCQGVTEWKDVTQGHPALASWIQGWRADSEARLQPLIEDGLVRVEPGRVIITARGLPLSRLIASVFDPLTQTPQSVPRYSQAV